MSLVIVLIVLFLAYSTSYFWGFGTSLLPLFWIIFQVVCWFPLCFFGLVRFYLVSSFVLYFCVFSVFFFFFFFSIVLHFKSPFPDFRVVSLLPFGFCSQWERLFQWFVLISCWRNLSLHCRGGSELFYYVFFLMEKAVWGSIIWSVCGNLVADIVFVLLSCHLTG